MFAEDAKEQTFATRDAWDEAIDRGIEAFEQRPRDVPFWFYGNGYGLGFECIYHPTDVLLVFFCIECAGTIYERSIWLETLPCVLDDVALKFPALLNILGAPFTDSGRVFTEHAFARAWHIAEYEVELELGFAEVARVIVGDNAVGPTPLSDVLEQNLGAISHRFIAHEHTVLGQHTAQSRRLATRGCAEVEDFHRCGARV